MKYSEKFEKDYQFFLRVKDVFNFDGSDCYINKKGIDIIQYDPNGKTAKECFYLYDSSGVIAKTREPFELTELLKTKGSINLHIKMYAQDRAKGYLPKIEFNKIVKELDLPHWFIEAVENQKYKYYNSVAGNTTNPLR